MRGFQQSFQRAKNRFTYEEREEIKLMLWYTVLLIALRARTVGLNQILPIYKPLVCAEVNMFLRSELGLLC